MKNIFKAISVLVLFATSLHSVISFAASPKIRGLYANSKLVQHDTFCELLLTQQPKAFGNFRPTNVLHDYQALAETWLNFGLEGAGFQNDLGQIAGILFLKGFKFQFQLVDRPTWYSSEKLNDLRNGSPYWSRRLAKEPMTDIKLAPRTYVAWLWIVNEANKVLYTPLPKASDGVLDLPEASALLERFTRPQMEALFYGVYSGPPTTMPSMLESESQRLVALFLAGGFKLGQARKLADNLLAYTPRPTNKFNRYRIRYDIGYLDRHARDPISKLQVEYNRYVALIAAQMYIPSRPGSMLDLYYEHQRMLNR